MTLVAAPNLPHADSVDERMIAARERRSASDSAALNARLILLLMNHIGDAGIVLEAAEAAADATPSDA